MGALYLYLPIHVNFNIVCTYKIDTGIRKYFLWSNLLKGVNSIQIYCALTSEIDCISLLFHIFFLDM